MDFYGQERPCAVWGQGSGALCSQEITSDVAVIPDVAVKARKFWHTALILFTNLYWILCTWRQKPLFRAIEEDFKLLNQETCLLLFGCCLLRAL